MKAHATHKPSTGLAQEQNIRQDPLPSIAVSSGSSELPPIRSQHMTQISRQLQPYNGNLGVKHANKNRTRGLQDDPRRRDASRLTTPTESQRSNLSLSASRPSQSTGFATSAFSFRAPTQGDYSARDVPHYEHNRRQMSTPADARASAGPAEPPSRTLNQPSNATTRTRTCNSRDLRISTHRHVGRLTSGNSLSVENLDLYVEIMKESERALKGSVVYWPLSCGH